MTDDRPPAGSPDTDPEAIALFADEHPEEAAALTARIASRRPWLTVLEQEFAQEYFRELMRFVDAERRAHPHAIYPAEDRIFAAFHLTSYDEVKVVIVGQDPYPNPGEATGLCFSVPTGVRMPRSLVNICAALREDGFTPPDGGDLSPWAEQGVLLLNTALTVRRGEPGSHMRLWRPFTDAVVRQLDAREERLVFVLWGREAQKLERRGLIDPARHSVVRAPHPASRGRSQRCFREARTFSQVNSLLGDREIAWSRGSTGP